MEGTNGTQVSLYDKFVSQYGNEVKPREGNNIRLSCPECGHKSLSCNIQSGLIHCFHCDYGKGLKAEGMPSGFKESPVDRELHLKVTQKIIEISTLEDDHREYLVSRGIYRPEEYQLKSVPFRIDKLLLSYFTEEELISSGYFSSGSGGYNVSMALEPRRILIPYWSGDEIIGLKSRVRPNSDPLGVDKRYICPRGSKYSSKPWYKGSLGPDIVITEGELSAMSCQENGIPAIGLAGLGASSSEPFLVELKKIVNEYGVNRCFIMLDSDPGISNDASKLKSSISLFKAIPRSCILYLPQDSPEEKMDLDLYLSRYEVQNLLEMMEDAWHQRVARYNGLWLRIKRLNEGRNKNSGQKNSSNLWKDV